MKKEKFSIMKRVKSFSFAFNGLKLLFIEEHNAILHLLASGSVFAMGLFYEISNMEWVAILFSIGFVFTTEIINTSIENLCDFMTTEKNESIKKIKDLSAASVLVSSLTVFIIGLVIFIPKIIES